MRILLAAGDAADDVCVRIVRVASPAGRRNRAGGAGVDQGLLLRLFHFPGEGGLECGGRDAEAEKGGGCKTHRAGGRGHIKILSSEGRREASGRVQQMGHLRRVRRADFGIAVRFPETIRGFRNRAAGAEPKTPIGRRKAPAGDHASEKAGLQGVKGLLVFLP